MPRCWLPSAAAFSEVGYVEGSNVVVIETALPRIKSPGSPLAYRQCPRRSAA